MRLVPLKNQSEDSLLRCVGTASIGTDTANLFHYQKFGLREINIYRDGFATAGTIMSTTDNMRLYYNSMSLLAYDENGLKMIWLSVR